MLGTVNPLDNIMQSYTAVISATEVTLLTL